MKACGVAFVHLEQSMRQFLLTAAASIALIAAAHADDYCGPANQILVKQVRASDEKNDALNVVTGRIRSYLVTGAYADIHPADVRAWKPAIEDDIAAHQQMLQSLQDYQAHGCNSIPADKLNEAIAKATREIAADRRNLAGIAALTSQ
jgi:hypothetical protein